VPQAGCGVEQALLFVRHDPAPPLGDLGALQGRLVSDRRSREVPFSRGRPKRRLQHLNVLVPRRGGQGRQRGVERLDRVLGDADERPLAEPAPVGRRKSAQAREHRAVILPGLFPARLGCPLDIDRRERIQRDDRRRVRAGPCLGGVARAQSPPPARPPAPATSVRGRRGLAPRTCVGPRPSPGAGSK
jgi:hypothetical protein